MKRAALVIVTYNNPAFLGICLASYKNQSYKNFEIFIADDGSLPETKMKIDEYRKILPQPITHFWHPDVGYRKAQIVNHVWRSLDPAEFPVVINVDHDTIAHRRFVEDHVRAHLGARMFKVRAEHDAPPRAHLGTGMIKVRAGHEAPPRANEEYDNLIFMGRRVNLGPQVAQTYTEQNVTALNHGLPWRLVQAAWRKDIEDPNRALRIGSAWLRKMLGRDKVPDLLGSNFSISNKLLRAVNGYNEEYKHYWGEDGDLFIRVRNSGAKLAGSRAVAIQYHLWHKFLAPDPAAMENYYKVLLPSRDYRYCDQGITGSRENTKDVMVYKN